MFHYEKGIVDILLKRLRVLLFLVQSHEGINAEVLVPVFWNLNATSWAAEISPTSGFTTQKSLRSGPHNPSKGCHASLEGVWDPILS